MSEMSQGDKLIKRLEDAQKRAKKPILVSMMVLIGENGTPVCWTLREMDKVEGLCLVDFERTNML